MWLQFVALLILGSVMLVSIRAEGTKPEPMPTIKTTTTTTRAPVTTSTGVSGKTIFKLPTNIDEDELLHETGLYMLANMNLEIDPCEDFYEYACGNWKNSDRVPADGRKESLIAVMQREIQDLIVTMLKNSSFIDTKTAEGKAKTFFGSCLSGGKDVSVGLKVLLENEKQVFETLQTTGKDDWIAINFMSPYNIYPLLPLSVNYSTVTREFEISIALPQPILENFPDAANIDELTAKFGTIASDYKLMLEFERNLTSKVQAKEQTERLNLLDFLQQHQKDPIDWQTVFQQAFGEHLSNEWYVNNKIANYTDLERFLRKSNIENMRNYVKWRTILKFYSIWNAKIEGDERREQICRQHTESYFTFALIPWFIDTLYNTERREDTLLLANSILASFLNMTSEYSWLDEDTRSHIMSKLQAMDIFVGYKDETRHRDVINEVYADVEVSSDWFKNLLVLEENNARIRLRSVHKTVLPPMVSPYSVNAYYADYINTAFITMGISQMPLYNIRFPASLKFGGLGMLIGHEMAHSLDTNGFHLDYDGKRYKWPVATLRQFLIRIRCLENQYNKFIFRGIQTNGTLTLPDNIADNAGARLAHNAYMEIQGKKEGLKKPIPGMDFNNNELFFIKLAQTWCTGQNETYKMTHIHNNVHAFFDFRVLGTLRNMKEFSNTFHCKLGSQMNPLKKCVVW